MAKVHYEGYPCKSEPFPKFRATSGSDKFSKEFEVYYEPLPKSNNWQEVTCKICIRFKPND